MKIYDDFIAQQVSFYGLVSFYLSSFLYPLSFANSLGDCQKIIYPQAQDFCSFSRREKGRIASYAALFTMQKADKKTRLWANSSSASALVKPVSTNPRWGFYDQPR
jgi:hypothetical protein